jgi:uncharacterized membrane protein YhaH (DUF805 family)
MSEPQGSPGMPWLLFSPFGRISRRVYALSLLFWIVLPGIIIPQMFANEHDDGKLVLWTLALVIACGTASISWIMLSIKRVHDMGHPGIFAFLLFVPVANFFAFAAFLFWPSAGPNAFGEYTNRPK